MFPIAHAMHFLGIMRRAPCRCSVEKGRPYYYCSHLAGHSSSVSPYRLRSESIRRQTRPPSLSVIDDVPDFIIQDIQPERYHGPTSVSSARAPHRQQLGQDDNAMAPPSRPSRPCKHTYDQCGSRVEVGDSSSIMNAPLMVLSQGLLCLSRTAVLPQVRTLW
ncbi:hypothetical protein C8Q77DRAFT_685627 [Trametes polyzona]|nr:hypothetical protein C8Q77DRAFT_685627 [Trametes polyzona]